MIVCSHFDRPKGKRVPEMSLRPIAAALAEVLGKPVAFAEDCVGEPAQAAVDAMADGDVLVLENTRFHAGEEANHPGMSQALASLADVYVNDAFSAAHRAHASTEGVAHLLPAYAGRLMQAGTDGAGGGVGHAAAAGGGNCRGVESLDQAGFANQSRRKSRYPGDRRRYGKYLSGGSGL